jgi:5-methylcytosine-specific restriction endonuclease McrA
MGEKNRIPSKAGWCNPTKLPRGPNGRALCRQCGREVPKSCRSFCSDACVHTWKLTTDPGYQRKEVLKRDHGICSMCGLDTVALERAFREAKRAIYREQDGRMDQLLHHDSWFWRGGRYREAEERLRVLGFIPDRSFWEMDHVHAVVEGGGGCDISNLRTLCRPCHIRVTRELRARLAANRKIVRRPMP